MQKFLAPLLFLVFALTAAFDSAEQPATAIAQTSSVSLGEFLYTVTLNKDMPIEDAQYRWFHEYLEPGVNDSVFEPLLELIKRKQITVYEPIYPFQTKMDPDVAAGLFVSVDSVVYEDPFNPGELLYAMLKNEQHAYEVVSLTFHERWDYDPATLSLTKTVLGIIPNLERFANMGEPLIKLTCYIPINNNPLTSATVTVGGITSDFTADGETHNNDINVEFIARDSGVSVNQNKVAVRILGDIKSKSNEKNFTLYEPDFPFTHAVDKSLKAGKLTMLDKANMLMFYEDWEINPRQRVFRKTVKGVIPRKESVFVPDSGKSKWVYENSALIPFNGFVPTKINSEVCVIDRISFDVFYKNEQQVRPKEMSLDDSAFMDTISMDIM